MTAPLLHVGDATVWPSIWGGHVVDRGDAFPQPFSDRRAAYAEAAARSLNSPPVGGRDPLPVEGPASTPGVAGRLDGCASSPVGSASGSPVASPRSSGPDASYSSSVAVVAGVTEEAMGAAGLEAPPPPPIPAQAT